MSELQNASWGCVRAHEQPSVSRSTCRLPKTKSRLIRCWHSDRIVCKRRIPPLFPGDSNPLPISACVTDDAAEEKKQKEGKEGEKNNLHQTNERVSSWLLCFPLLQRCLVPDAGREWLASVHIGTQSSRHAHSSLTRHPPPQLARPDGRTSGSRTRDDILELCNRDGGGGFGGSGGGWGPKMEKEKGERKNVDNACMCNDR